jgi:pimeloyl-ACP methyl ester carboxylesterase
VKAATILLSALVLASGCAPWRTEPSAPAELKKIIVNGAELSYLEDGVGETVIFLHGVGTDLRIWEGVRPHIATKYRFIAYSRRHHVPNAWPDAGSSHTLAHHVEDLAALVPALGVDKAHIVGASLGGSIAGEMVVRYPHLVQSIILNDSLLVQPVSEDGRRVMEPFWKAFQPFYAAVKAGNGAEAPVALVNWLSGKPDAWDSLPPDRKKYYVENAGALLRVFEEAPRPGPTCADLGKLQVPVLVMAGESTPAAFQLSNERLVQCLSHGTAYRRVSNADHFWYAENAGDGAAAILQFLTEHPILRADRGQRQ